MLFDCAMIGGGIAGLQAAIQLARYRRHVIVIDSGAGRSGRCQMYHNILGWPDGVSGPTLRQAGRRHAESMGVTFFEGRVHRVHPQDDAFLVTCAQGPVFSARRVLFATGIEDRIPPIPHLNPLLGLSVYVCPDCDGYEVTDRRTIVIGAGDVGANMALTLRHWTDDLIYVNHEHTEVSSNLTDALQANHIEYIDDTVTSVLTERDSLMGVSLQSRGRVFGERAFVAFGGNPVHSELAKALGVECHHNGHILVNPRTKQTNVPGVWAAGDVVAHSEQVSIAMGDGSQAAIWIHKSLQTPSTFPEKCFDGKKM